jgi:hypothetical protein
MPIGLADRIAGYVTEAYKSIPRRGAEAGGLLLGGVRLGPVIDIFITGFEPIPCDHLSGPSFTVSDAVQSEFRAAIARHASAEVIGYYRSHTRKGAGLETSDQDLVDRVFPGMSGLVLLIKPNGVSSLTGGYFFFQTGRLEMRPVGPEFPFLVSIPGGIPPPSIAEPDMDGRPEAKAPEPKFKELLQESLAFAELKSSEKEAPVSAPPVSTPIASGPIASGPQKVESAPRKVEAAALNFEAAAAGAVYEGGETNTRRRKLQWEIVAAGLMIMAALALLWWQYRGASGEEDAAASLPVPSHVAALGLTVRPGEGGWRITWNPASVAARGSVRGALDVTEDASHERIPLDESQIRAGAATYRPIGDDITFRLDLIAGDDSLATETYRVVIKARDSLTSSGAQRPVKTAKPAPKPEKQAEPSSKPSADREAADKPAPDKPTADYVESEVASRVTPEVPEGIRPRITSPLPIDVRVSIDREGHVTKATAVQHEDGLVDYLGKRAVAAARQWNFTPAKRAGKPVDSSRTIHFVFEQ